MTQEKIKEQINSIKEDLGMIMILRPGSLSQQYNVCGKKECACKNKKDPKKHGPYNILSYRHRGKNHTEFIRKQFINDTKEWSKDYQLFLKLIDKWIDLSIKLSKLEMKNLISEKP